MTAAAGAAGRAAAPAAGRVLDCTRDDVAAGPQRYDPIPDTGGNAALARLRRALTPATGTTYPPRQAPDAMRDLLAGHARGKLILTMTGPDKPPLERS
jgi:hypothetical protein